MASTELTESLDTEHLATVFGEVISRDRASVDPEEGGHYYTARGLHFYDILLPHYNEKSFLETLTSKAHKAGQPIDVLDVGCGQGVALAEIIRDYNVRAAGIAATDLRHHAPEKLQDFVGQIDLRTGDIHDLEGIFPDRKFDLIVSAKTFEHLRYPDLVTPQIARLLKPGGLAFIQDPEQGGIVLTPQMPTLMPVFYNSHPVPKRVA